MVKPRFISHFDFGWPLEAKMERRIDRSIGATSGQPLEVHRGCGRSMRRDAAGRRPRAGAAAGAACAQHAARAVATAEPAASLAAGSAAHRSIGARTAGLCRNEVVLQRDS